VIPAHEQALEYLAVPEQALAVSGTMLGQIVTAPAANMSASRDGGCGGTIVVVVVVSTLVDVIVVTVIVEVTDAVGTIVLDTVRVDGTGITVQLIKDEHDARRTA
jgi:hypothetical protein